MQKFETFCHWKVSDSVIGLQRCHQHAHTAVVGDCISDNILFAVYSADNVIAMDIGPIQESYCGYNNVD